MLGSLAVRAASATATAPQTKLLKLADQLLPPLVLYRRLLRVHRKVLPIEMRLMGDEYVKAEFRRTKSTDNPLHIVGFLSEWKKYLEFHEAQLLPENTGVEGEKEIREREGRRLDPELLEKLSAEQIGQLYELLQATKEIWKEPSTEGKEEEEVGGIPKSQVLPDLSGAHDVPGGAGKR
ncbi:ACN9-domain-containing protein [Meredithblackwellia eburnea MCA 4105]